MARGGARVGKPATPYGNRTDLPGKVLPITAAPGQQYGAAGAQMAAQRVVPMASPPSPGAPAGGGPPQAGPPPVPPGGLGHIARPSERPAEHVMTGVASGPGAGPEAIPGYNPNQVPPSTTRTLGTLLNGLAAQPNATPEVRNLAAFVGQGKL